MLYSNLCYMEVCYKEIHCNYFLYFPENLSHPCAGHYETYTHKKTSFTACDVSLGKNYDRPMKTSQTQNIWGSMRENLTLLHVNSKGTDELAFAIWTVKWSNLPDEYLCLLFLYVPSTIFQLYRDGSSWVGPVLS